MRRELWYRHHFLAQMGQVRLGAGGSVKSQVPSALGLAKETWGMWGKGGEQPSGAKGTWTQGNC